MKFLIDGNAFLNVPTNVVIYLLNKKSQFDEPIVEVDGNLFLKESTKEYYKSFMLKYLIGMLSPFRNAIDEVIIVFDSKSWRKVYTKKYYERKKTEPEKTFVYKGNRKDDASRQELFLYFNYFTDYVLPELCEFGGTSTIKVLGAEGDDLLATLCELMPKDDIILWTIDQDMKQLVEYGDRSIVVTGPKSKKTEKRPLYIHYSIEDTSPDLLNINVDNNSIKGMVDYLERNAEFDIIPIDPGKYILTQILAGQRKDNIPSIYTKQGTTGKNINITERKANKILDILKVNRFPDCLSKYIDSDDLEFKDEVIYAVADSEKIDHSDSDKLEAIREGFDLNSKLIRLSSKKIPDRLVCMIKHKFNNTQRDNKFNYSDYLKIAYPEA